MNKSYRVAMGSAALAVGVLALGACSSGAGDQPQQTHEAAAAESPAAMETMPPVKSGPFQGVVLTHNPGIPCTRKDSNTEAVFTCKNVNVNIMGDAVNVRVPGKNFHIHVDNLTPRDSYATIWSTQRDYAYNKIVSERERDGTVDWDAPDLWSAGLGWSAGVEYNVYGASENVKNDPETVDVRIVVTKK